MIIKRRPEDTRALPLPDGFEALHVADWETYWIARRIVEARKLTLDRLLIDISNPYFYELFRDLEVMGNGLALTFLITPSVELQEVVARIDPSASLPADFTDEVIAKSRVLERLDLFQSNLAKMVQQGRRESSSQWIKEAFLATTTGLPAMKPSSPADARTISSSIAISIFESRITGTIERISEALRVGMVAQGFSEIIQRLEALAPDRKEPLRAIRDALLAGDAADLVDSALATAALGPYLESSHLLGSEIARRMGLRLLPESSIDLEAVCSLIGEGGIQDNFARWARRVELEKAFAYLADDLPQLRELRAGTQEIKTTLRLLSGYYRIEFEAVLERIAHSAAIRDDATLSKDLAAELRAKFQGLAKADPSVADTLRVVDEACDIKGEFDALRLANPTNFPEWGSFCQGIMRTERRLGHLLSAVQEVKKEFPILEILAELWLELRDVARSSTSEYEGWLSVHYPAMLRDIESPLNCHALNRLRRLWQEGARVILLVVDGLRLDFWEIARAALGEEGWTPETDELQVSMLPSLTVVSRRCLAAGQAYSDLLTLCAGRWRGVSPQDEAQLFASALGLDHRALVRETDRERSAWIIPNSFTYCDDARSFEWAIGTEARFTVLVYKLLDEISHLQEHELHEHQDIMQAAFRTLAKRICRPLRRATDTKIAVATDHGFLPTNFGEQGTIPSALKAGTSASKIHQRCIVVSRIGSNPLPQVDNEQYVVWTEGTDDSPAKYGLPCEWVHHPVLGLGTVDMWVFPRSLDYFQRDAGFYVHGGLSYFETVIPFAILAPKSERALDPILDLEPKTLNAKDENRITVRIRNPNRIQMTDVRLTLKDLPQELAADTIAQESPLERIIRRKPLAQGRYRIDYQMLYSLGAARLQHDGQIEFRVDLSPEDKRRERLAVRRDVEGMFGGS